MIGSRSNKQQMAEALRTLASKIETAHEGLEFDAQVHVWSSLCSSVRTIEELRSVFSMLENAQAKGRHRSQWIEGQVGPITVTAHYAPGLLGQVRKTRVVEKDVEVATDMSRLMTKDQ